MLNHWGNDEDWPEMGKKARKQRGKNGIASSDIYAGDVYLAGIIIQLLDKLLEVEKLKKKTLKNLPPKEKKQYLKRRKRLKFVKNQMNIYVNNLGLPINQSEVSDDFNKALKWLHKYWATLWF